MTRDILGILAAGLAAVPCAFAQQLCPALIQWQQTFGDMGYDEPNALQQTSDGGFIIGGRSSYPYYEGEGNKTAPSYGSDDFWIVRTDGGGNKLWDQSYGGSGPDFALSLQQTSDGGFVLAGGSGSGAGGNKISRNYGAYDFWLVRTDSSGNRLWDQSFGGGQGDVANSVQQTRDGGFIVGGGSESQNIATGKTSPAYGSFDFWVVRTDSNGNKLWERSFGGAQTDWLYVIRETSNGGFLLGGSSDSGSSGNKTSASFGDRDAWLVRVDAEGNKLWDRSFGGNFADEILDLVQTEDGGFVIAGVSSSNAGTGNKTSPHYGTYDFWIIRLNADGDKLWDQSYGGASDDYLHSVSAVADGGFILSGWSYSGADGTKTSPRYGSSDYWMVRIDANGNRLWDQSFGSRSTDSVGASQQTSDGGFVIGGLSFGDGGNKTSPTFENGDFWVVKLRAETPADCDGDGIPDVQDRCSDTPYGLLVNTNGCAIEQLCPCTNNWQSANAYVQCVKSAAADLARAGLINRVQQRGLVEQAMQANCPSNFIPIPTVVFGLTNLPIGHAELLIDEESVAGSVTVSDAGIEGQDGVSILTGEADSGLFLYPDAPIWGNYDDSWFMLGNAIGRINGEPDSFISSLRVTKPNYESYPVDVDLTPLAPESLTFQVFSNRILVAEGTVEGSTVRVGIFSADYLHPRGNPFWRMPDGSVGALIEFTTPIFETGEYYRSQITGPWAGEGVQGDRIFIRANNPANRVDFVSRVDVTGFSGEFNTFSFLDERLGMFSRPHKALGRVTLLAKDGKLTVAAFPGLTAYFAGVLVEADLASRFDFDVEPVELASDGASLQFSASRGGGEEEEDDDITTFTSVHITNRDGVLELEPYFSPEYFEQNPTFMSPGLVQINVYKNGSLAGVVQATNGAVVGALTLRSQNRVPEIISCGVADGSSNSTPHLALTFRQQATFTGRDGAEFRGNQLRIVPVDSSDVARSFALVSLGTVNLPSFTITGEHSVLVPPPLRIVSTNDTLALSWPNVNQPFVLESAASLLGEFTTVTNDVEYIVNRNYLSLPVDRTASRFFRLRQAVD